MTDLIAVAHGTADCAGLRTIHRLTRLMALQCPDVPVSLGFVDLVEPALPELVDRVVVDSKQAVVVPLLLSSGYHVYVDIAGEAARHDLPVAPALGPDPVLAEVLADRLGDLTTVDQVVLAAAGSRDPRALADCQTTARLLSHRVNRPVHVGYLSGPADRLPDVLVRTPGRVAVATYLLAPGFFNHQVHHHARDLPVSDPLGADPRLAALALRRYSSVVNAVANGPWKRQAS